ncbi:leader peptide IlvL [Shewanella maritima]|uniref:Leader peptide IlvL n=1 Tax=Shewanella maritima TaxID=2520507 RepID=A0A411PIW7_9GAMM|nr:leader peptide IlvL [Shewanella maritima]
MFNQTTVLIIEIITVVIIKSQRGWCMASNQT